MTNPPRPQTHRDSLAARRALAAEWHPTKNAPLTPRDVHLHSHKLVFWRCRVDPSHEWTARVTSQARRDKCPRCAENALREERSLLACFPALAAEWHPSKNGTLTPAAVSYGSNREVWWRCSKDRRHVWQTAVARRATSGYGCPICVGKRVTPVSSLRALHPRIAAEWHPTENAPLTPDSVTAGSNRRVTWVCAADPSHVWLATIANRTKDRGTGCPFCAGRRLTASRSLAVCAPEVAAEWHPTKNGKLTPADVFANDTRKVWWRCRVSPAHVWETSAHTRARQGCPFCAGKRADRTNSLAALQPDLASEWHAFRNGELRPERVTSGSQKRVWWQCREDWLHVWQTSVANRTSRGSGCPFCAGKIATLSSSLLVRFPSIALEWHPEKNGGLSPADVTPGSSLKAWWRCSVDPSHEWATVVSRRTSHREPSGCPHCARLARGITRPPSSLTASHPELAREWHPTKNGALTPDAVGWGSAKRVWWRCSRSPAHVWCSRVVVRSNDPGCPECRRAAKSLAANRPDLAAEWHPTKNGTLTPATVFSRADKKVWWRCRLNAAHVWLARVAHRSKGTGCPYCYQAANVGRSRRGTERVARDPALASPARAPKTRSRESARARRGPRAHARGSGRRAHARGSTRRSPR